MKLIKSLIILLTLLVSVHAFAETKIVFLNGIDGDFWKNDDSKLKLSAILQKAGYGAKLSGVRYVAWNNPGDGFYDDKRELLTQASLSGEALTLAKITNPSATAQSQDYYEVLGNLYKNKINSGGAETEEARHVYSVVRDLSIYISSEIITRGNKLVIVSHSQGNFFAEAVAAYLTVTKTPAENLKLDANLRFVGVASVAASTPQYRYLSAGEDVALNLHALTTLAISNFFLLPRNVDLCSALLPSCLTEIKNNYDQVIHGFQEIYTSDLLDRITGKPMYKLLSDLVNESFTELNPPAPTIPAAQTALQNGLYEVDTNSSYICYHKSKFASSVSTTLIESKYCLIGGIWQLMPLDPYTLLMPNNSWIFQPQPQVIFTSNTTFDVKYDSQTLRNGTIELFDSTSAGNIYQSVVTTPAAEYSVFGGLSSISNGSSTAVLNGSSSQSITSIAELITTWNSSANGTVYLSRGGTLGWSFLGLGTDLQNTAPLYDISIPCPSVCTRNISAYGTWARTTLGNRTETSDILKLNIPVDRRAGANLQSFEQLIYVKRTSHATVEEGIYTPPGNVWSYKSYDKARMNATFAAGGYPPVPN